MNSAEFKEFIEGQTEEIQKYKWIQSEQKHKDIGKGVASVEWIKKYAKNYRNVWYCMHYCDRFDTSRCVLYEAEDDQEIREHCDQHDRIHKEH